MNNKQIFSMADRLKQLKDDKKALEAKVKEIGVEIDALESTLSNVMVTEEVDKFSRNGSTFYLTSKLYASPVSGKKDDMYAALKANGYASIVTQTVNAQTLASVCREMMAENDAQLPAWLDGLVNTYEKTSVGIRKS